MQIRWLSIPFIILTLTSISLVPKPVLGDAPNPNSTLAIGDWWKYELQTDLLGLTLRGTMTQTIESEERVFVNNTPVDSHRLALTGSGTASGNFQGTQLTGTWTLTGTFHQRKTDQAEISSRITIPVTITAQGVTVTVTVTVDARNSPPYEIYQFPLSVGKTWTTFTQTSITFSSPVIPQPETVSINRTITREVASSQLLTVPAGTYETFLVNASDSSGTYREDYYSPQVEATVKNIEYNATTRAVMSSQVLVEYSAWPYRSSISVPYILQNYALTIQADATISSTRIGSGSISFQVSGPDGVTGRARVTIPVQANRTSISVYLDGEQISAQTSKNSTHYQILFTFPLSTHTLTVVFATGLFAAVFGQFFLPLLLGGTVFIVAVVAAVLLLVLKRRKASQVPAVPPAAPAPTEQPPSP